jgi:hypothetical protein
MLYPTTPLALYCNLKVVGLALGVNVIIANFSDFRRKKMKVFSKANVMIRFLQKNNPQFEPKIAIFSPIFWQNYF